MKASENKSSLFDLARLKELGGFKAGDLLAVDPELYHKFMEHSTKTVKRDVVTKNMVFLTGLSAFTSQPINLFLRGESSIGKTYNVIEVLKYFPKEDVWLLGGLSPTALVHDKGKLVDENGEEIELEKKPVKPHKTDYESERDYKQARQEYKEQKETWGASELLYTSKQNEEGGRMKMTDLPAEIIIEKRKMQAEGKDVKYLIVTSQTHIELLEILKQQSKFFPRHIHATRLKEFKDLTIIEVENLLYQKFMLGYRPSTRLSLK